MTDHDNEDIAAHRKRIHDQIVAKQKTRPRVDAQGRIVGKQKLWQYDRDGNLLGEAEEQPDPDVTWSPS